MGKTGKAQGGRRKAVKCPRCHKGGFSQSEADGDRRPQFACACGHIWTCGKDGGEYALGIALARIAEREID